MRKLLNSKGFRLERVTNGFVITEIPLEENAVIDNTPIVVVQDIKAHCETPKNLIVDAEEIMQTVAGEIATAARHKKTFKVFISIDIL